MLRFISFALLAIGASAQCTVCSDGGVPSNPNTPVPAIGGITCGYFYSNPTIVGPKSQQCIAVHQTSNQELCGCNNRAGPPGGVVPVPTKPSAPVVRSTPSPLLGYKPQSLGRYDCDICVNGGVPKYQDPTKSPGPTVPQVGLTCGYIYSIASLIRKVGQVCQAIRLPANQALCGCPGAAPTPVTAPTKRPVLPPTKRTPAPTFKKTPSPTNPKKTPAPVKRTPSPVVRQDPTPGGVVPVPVSCQVCVGGGEPKNLNTPVPAIGGITCGYFYFNPDIVGLTGQQCKAIRAPANQKLCGCP